MKVYICYYKIPNTKKYEFTIFNLLPKNNSRFTQMRNEDDYIVGYYGFCKDKKIFEIFKKYHKEDLFIYRKKEMDEDVYEIFEHENAELKIQYYPKKEKSILNYDNIPLAKHEYINIDYYCSELFFELLSSNVIINPSIFTEKYELYLYKIGYEHDYVYSNSEDEDEIDYYNYNSSYMSEEFRSLFDITIDENVPFIIYYSILYEPLIDNKKLIELL